MRPREFAPAYCAAPMCGLEPGARPTPAGPTLPCVCPAHEAERGGRHRCLKAAATCASMVHCASARYVTCMQAHLQAGTHPCQTTCRAPPRCGAPRRGRPRPAAPASAPPRWPGRAGGGPHSGAGLRPSLGRRGCWRRACTRVDGGGVWMHCGIRTWAGGAARCACTDERAPPRGLPRLAAAHMSPVQLAACADAASVS